VALLLLAAILLSVSCSLDSLWVQRLLVSAPLLPEAWAFEGECSFELSWIDAEGGRRVARLAAGERIEVGVRRGSFQALLAKPDFRGMALRPVGALYPEGLLSGPEPFLGLGIGEVEELRLDALGGYEAALAMSLAEAGGDPEAYDFGAEAAQILARLADPWLLPPGEAAGLLIEGRLGPSALRPASRFTVELPGPGPWYPESPFGPVPAPAGGAETGGAGASFSAELPPGIHRFVAEGEELFVEVRENGSSVVVRRPRSRALRRFLCSDVSSPATTNRRYPKGGVRP
jgi:hypothetical protein